MTADERIEKLLNHFGQTIADLPKADGMHHVYDCGHRKMAEKTAYEWHKVIGPYFDMIDSVRMLDSYICHLADVIDRMEIALETALIQLDGKCNKCSSYDDCDGNCSEQFRIIDTLLIDPELEIEIDDAD